MTPQKPVIFFDGVCGLCNAFVDFVFTRDIDHKFLFAPIQGKTASELLPKELTKELTTIVLWRDGQMKLKAEAATEILKQLGGPLAWASELGAMMPKFLQIRVYDLVAANRYQLFGRRDQCRLPTADEAPYFLN